jgi:hypothetical protein
MGTFRRLSLLVVTLALTALVTAPAALADNNICSDTNSVSPRALLLNPNSGFSPGEATVPLVTPIPAGDYSLTMVSFDDHDAKLVDQSDQINEQWYLQLLDAEGNTVFKSWISPDLPGDQNWLIFNSSASVTGEAVTMRVVHAAIGDNVNSIVAVCARFNPIAPTPGSIGDTVWFDTNGNGVQDGTESGIEGVTVLLTSPGSTSPLVATTGANGSYIFAGLEAGSYDVAVDATTGPAGSDLTTPAAVTVALAEGEDFVDADFGFTTAEVLASAVIGDTVWMDSNLNQVLDAGEGLLAGVSVTLTNMGTNESSTLVSNASGKYLFAALTAGTYEVTVNTGTAPDNTGLTTAGKYTITVVDGQSSLIADFGFAPQLPSTGLETADFGIAGLVLLLIGGLTLALVRPGKRAPWHLVNAYEVD